MKTKLLFSLTLVVVSLIVACSGKSSTGKSSNDKMKVALVVNQRFGDNGPMDDMAKGADRAAKDFGVEIKKLESISAANFEEDIRAMSKNYDLIITTFPYMSDATKLVAKEYPNKKYAAIFQFINSDKESVDNIWDTEFHGEQAFYLAGYLAAKASKTGRIGIIIGGEEPTPNAEGNGFMMGAKAANPNITVEFAFVGSYEDPAKAKEMASAMIAKGCDFLEGNAGMSNAGIIEAAKEANIMAACEITDFYDSFKGFFGVIGMGFGETVYTGIKMAAEGNFVGGKRKIMDLSNGGYYMMWDTYERFVKDNAERGAELKLAIEEAKALETKIKNGDLVIPFNVSVPNWNNFK